MTVASKPCRTTDRYKGYRYHMEFVEEKDKKYIFHTAIADNGDMLFLPVRTAKAISFEYFKTWIDAGYPSINTGVLSLEDLQDMIADNILLKNGNDERG